MEMYAGSQCNVNCYQTTLPVEAKADNYIIIFAIPTSSPTPTTHTHLKYYKST